MAQARGCQTYDAPRVAVGLVGPAQWPKRRPDVALTVFGGLWRTRQSRTVLSWPLVAVVSVSVVSALSGRWATGRWLQVAR